MTITQSPLLPLIVTPENVPPIKPFGLDMRILLSTQASGGITSVVMASHQPGEGPPDHLHLSQEECIFVVEGTYSVSLNGALQTVGAGTLMFIPRGTVHSFKNVGTTTARMLDWSLPGGQDLYFEKVAELTGGGGFDVATAIEVSRAHDTHFPRTA